MRGASRPQGWLRWAILRKSKPTGAVPEQGQQDYFATLPSIRHARGVLPGAGAASRIWPWPDHAYDDDPRVADALTPYGVWPHSAGAPHRRGGKALQSHGNGPASEVAWRVTILPFNAMFILW